jgi:Flagellar basal body rod FlgEFG protein C-terminal
MPLSPTAVTSALNALRMYGRRVDRAAEAIATAGLADFSLESRDGDQLADGASPTSAGDAPLDLGGAMASMLVAQRAFAAQLRVLRTADEMLRDAADLTKP